MNVDDEHDRRFSGAARPAGCGASWMMRLAFRGMMAGVLCAGGGCAVPGAIAYKVFGPAPIPARYAPPKDQPMLVLVENAHSGSAAIPETDELSRVIYDELREQKVAPLIDPVQVHELRDRDSAAFGKMTIAQIGRRLGARQVLYVDVNALDVENAVASDLVKLKMAADVKVVDATSAQTTWPQSGESVLFEFALPPQRVASGATPSQLKRQILHEGGTELSRWFYNFKPETMTEENKDVKLR